MGQVQMRPGLFAGAAWLLCMMVIGCAEVWALLVGLAGVDVVM